MFWDEAAPIAPTTAAKGLESGVKALVDVEPDTAQAGDDALRFTLDLRGVDHRAEARGHAAADVADLVKRRVSPRMDTGYIDSNVPYR